MGAILSTGGVTAWVKELHKEAFHLNLLFPEDSNETVTFTAGGSANTFGAWAEIVDNNGIKLSSKFNSYGHVASVIAEDASVKDSVYVWEIAYGAGETIVAKGRMISATNKINATAQNRMRTLKILGGESVYYRMKCETASATMAVHLRYHTCG